LRPRDAELARSREFDEPFFFTSADDQAIARFVATASEHGFQTRPGKTFWHISAGCDAARAVRTVTQLFRTATHNKLSGIGVGSSEEDLTWLRATDHAILLPSSSKDTKQTNAVVANAGRRKNISSGDAPGPTGWNTAILSIIS